jgi:oligopeptide transport system substrate-binding protein
VNRIKYCLPSILLLSQTACFAWVWNNPYPEAESQEKIYYTSFSEQPKTLDPAKSYSANEYTFIAQIYEPILQYNYLARPYQLEPLTAKVMPAVHYYDDNNQEIKDPQQHAVAKTVYTIEIKPGILYQPHPAFAKDKTGNFIYHNLPADYLEEEGINQLSDFKHTGTRELVADDYIYEIKRLATPNINSPIYGLMSEHIEGFREFAAQLPSSNSPAHFLDLRPYTIKGVRKSGDYSFEITLKGQYPQFMFWLAMPFFAPLPWEADRFYSQHDMDDKNLGFGWYPVGTGPFMLQENNPNSRMILAKNPNFRQEFFPLNGSAKDEKKGYLHHRGAILPLIDKAVYALEKEAIPRWNKFLQGYYDLSGVSPDSFDQAIMITPSGIAGLTESMREKGIRLVQTTDPSVFYLGFNMLDSVVGGHSERARKLRQAISIAVNYDENIAIFLSGQGLPAQGPIPPGIFGFHEGKAGINPYVYTWDGSAPRRRPIEDAKTLMKEAGYPEGVDPVTGEALILHYDVPATGGPDDKEQLNWMRKQFTQIGISLNIRATQYNRFQEKMRSGNAQIFTWGWNADYPDPENFLFLLYSGNGKVAHGGENAANYSNSNFDRLFVQMKNLNNGEERQKLIDQMIEIVRHDAPWAWGINSQSLILSQQWFAPVKSNSISLNTLKYVAINVPLRNDLRAEWNQPILWPLGLLLLILIALLLPFVFAYYKKQKQHADRVFI